MTMSMMMIMTNGIITAHGDTGNGEAFNRIAGLSQKVLAMTGTPFNGRSSSIFNLEYALNPRWSLKAEYLYYDLGRVSLILTDLLNRPGGVFQEYSVGVKGHIVRAGLNYRFGR